MITRLRKMINKLTDALSNLGGWIVATTALLMEYIYGHGTAIYLVLVLVIIDMILGIRVSHRRHRFTLSALARETVSKIEVYGLTILVFIGVDALLPDIISVTTEVVCALIILIEFWSASASLLILHPDTPLLRLLQKKLTGEIASKLDVEPEDVDDILKGKNPTKNETTETED